MRRHLFSTGFAVVLILAGTNTFDRFAAAYAVASIDPTRPSAAVAELRSGLRSNQHVVAADCLGILGEAAQAAIPNVEAALNDPEPQFPDRARIALQKITGRRYPKR